jgi:glycosyltransferase involved in cell wall biosynthesis
MNIEFVIGTYNRPYHLATLLGSILTQTVPNWKVHVVLDGYFKEIDKIHAFFAFDNRIRWTVINGPNNDYGNTPRMYGLQTCNEDWVVMTGDDNYYSPVFVEEFFNVVDDKTNFVCWDTLLNFTNRDPKYRGIQYTQPFPEYIDLGAFATRPQLARQITYKVKSETGDGEFAQDYVASFCNEQDSYKKIDKLLYVHN